MKLTVNVQKRMAAPIQRIFALTLDSERFPSLFKGCGPIPGLRRIRATQPAAIGSWREVESMDGSQLRECITALDAPEHHAYRLSGLRPPLLWLTAGGDACWQLKVDGRETEVEWRYVFELRHALLWPIAAPLLGIFMRCAMDRCLQAMAHCLHCDAEKLH